MTTAIRNVVAVELAAALLLVAASTGAVAWLVAAVPAAVVLVIFAIGRQKLAHRTRFHTRRRTLPAGAPLLAVLRPGSNVRDADQVGVLADGYGLTAVLELGEPSALLLDTPTRAPSPAALLPRFGPDQPAVRVQLLLSGARAFLAVHVRREAGFTTAGLNRALRSAVRRVRRRLTRDGPGCRPLCATAIAHLVGELAHHHGVVTVERWSTVDTGRLCHASFRVDRWPDRPVLADVRAIPGTTVSLAVERAQDDARAELVIRVTAAGPQKLDVATDALRRVLTGAGATVTRLDGVQAAGLAATLPLGGAVDPGATSLAPVVDRRSAAALLRDGPLIVSEEAVGAALPALGGGGLTIGVNRQGAPTAVRLFRPEPTRAVLAGGVGCAQLLILRALALGARVVVQTACPHHWAAFLRAVGPTDALVAVPAGRPLELAPATAALPQLVVLDGEPAGAADVHPLELPWRATLLLRAELTATDVDALARADLVLLQPLRPSEAAVAGAALGLGDGAEWLTRIRGDMVGIVAGRRTLRWALLSAGPAERQLVGGWAREEWTPAG